MKHTSDTSSKQEYLDIVNTAIEKIQHDINNPLCIATMSLSRLELLMEQFNHPELAQSYAEISESLERVMVVLEELEELKNRLQ